MTSLNPSESETLESMRHASPPVDRAIRQLDRILESSRFARARCATREFLRFVVSKTLIGKADEIKEITIAIRVFAETAEFDPLVNSRIRVAAWALRRRLAAYYVDEGRRDPIEIVMRIGSYVPRFCVRDRGTLPPACTGEKSSTRYFPGGT